MKILQLIGNNPVIFCTIGCLIIVPLVILYNLLDNSLDNKKCNIAKYELRFKRYEMLNREKLQRKRGGFF